MPGKKDYKYCTKNKTEKNVLWCLSNPIGVNTAVVGELSAANNFVTGTRMREHIQHEIDQVYYLLVCFIT